MDQKLNNVLNKYKDDPGNTIVVLQEIQKLYSYLPPDALQKTADFYHQPLSEIYGVATFYSQFKFNRPGKYNIKVCHGTACHINGAVKISQRVEELLGIGPDETTADGTFSIEDVACLGCCSLAPVIMINNKVYGKLDDKKLKKILKGLN